MGDRGPEVRCPVGVLHLLGECLRLTVPDLLEPPPFRTGWRALVEILRAPLNSADVDAANHARESSMHSAIVAVPSGMKGGRRLPRRCVDARRPVRAESCEATAIASHVRSRAV